MVATVKSVEAFDFVPMGFRANPYYTEVASSDFS